MSQRVISYSDEPDAKHNYSDRESEDEFPGPAKVLSSSVYGNYVVASRRIEQGELICEEAALLVSPYGPSDRMPFCLNCYKDLAFSEKCSRCRWPICDNGMCRNAPPHCDAECQIFVDNCISPKGDLIVKYSGIEVLRCLLLRETHPSKWKKILKFESHILARRESPDDMQVTEYITNFVRNTCKLIQYDPDTIDRVIGVVSVNTFWAHQDLQKYASLLFDRITLLAHDCDYNTKRQIMDRQVKDDKGRIQNEFYMRIHAARTIEPGESITTHYTDCEQGVKQRQSELRDLFHFDCTCKRCLNELMADINLE